MTKPKEREITEPEWKTRDKGLIKDQIRDIGSDNIEDILVLEGRTPWQCNFFMETVWDSFEKLCYVISENEEIKAKPISDPEHPTYMELARVVKDENENEYILPFNKPNPGFKCKVWDRLRVHRWITHAVDDKKRKIVLITKDKVPASELILKGMKIDLADKAILGEDTKINTALPVFMVTEFKEDKEEYNIDTLRTYATTLKGDLPKIFFQQYPHPLWFRQLIMAYVLHSKQGVENKWPFHLMWIAKRGLGKSVIGTIIQRAIEPETDGLDCAASTLKKVIPSFAEKPPKQGYLAECKRMGFLDEFLKLVTKSSRYADENLSLLASMNNLLEHKTDLSCGSGVGSIKPVVTARFLVATNTSKKTSTLIDMIQMDDSTEAFFSRWLIYPMTKTHAKYIEEQKNTIFKPYNIKNKKLLRQLIHYCQDTPVIYDDKKVIEVFIKGQKILEQESVLHEFYCARMRHHLRCILDGIVKYRCLNDGDLTFEVIDDDYEELERMLHMILVSWIEGYDIKCIPLKTRADALSWIGQQVWTVIKETKGITKDELMDILVKRGLIPGHIGIALNQLYTYDLVFESKIFNKIYPYFCTLIEDNPANKEESAKGE